MAALQSTTAVVRHVLGDLAVRYFTVSGTNADTLSVTGISQILQVVGNPTTAIDLGITWSGTTITFATAGAFAATIAVYSRVG